MDQLDRQAAAARIVELEAEAMTSGNIACDMKPQAHSVWVPGSSVAAPERGLYDSAMIGFRN